MDLYAEGHPFINVGYLAVLVMLLAVGRWFIDRMGEALMLTEAILRLPLKDAVFAVVLVLLLGYFFWREYFASER